MKTFVVFAASAVAAVAVAGCAPSTGGSAGGETGSGSGTVKMVLWPGPEGEAMSKVVQEYNAGQGKTDKVKVEMTLLSEAGRLFQGGDPDGRQVQRSGHLLHRRYNVGQFAPSLYPLTRSTHPTTSRSQLMG